MQRFFILCVDYLHIFEREEIIYGPTTLDHDEIIKNMAIELLSVKESNFSFIGRTCKSFFLSSHSNVQSKETKGKYLRPITVFCMKLIVENLDVVVE